MNEGGKKGARYPIKEGPNKKRDEARTILMDSLDKIKLEFEDEISG